MRRRTGGVWGSTPTTPSPLAPESGSIETQLRDAQRAAHGRYHGHLAWLGGLEVRDPCFFHFAKKRVGGPASGPSRTNEGIPEMLRVSLISEERSSFLFSLVSRFFNILVLWMHSHCLQLVGSFVAEGHQLMEIQRFRWVELRRGAHTVDGRNPAPLGNHGKPLFMGIYRTFIILGFLRWCRIPSIHSIKCQEPGFQVSMWFSNGRGVRRRRLNAAGEFASSFRGT